MKKTSSDIPHTVHFLRSGKARVNVGAKTWSFESHADAIAHLKRLGLDYTKMIRFGDPHCYPVRR